MMGGKVGTGEKRPRRKARQALGKCTLSAEGRALVGDTKCPQDLVPLRAPCPGKSMERELQTKSFGWRGLTSDQAAATRSGQQTV